MTATVNPAPARVVPEERPIQVAVYESDNETHVADLTTDITGSRTWTDELPGIGDLGQAAVTVPLWEPDENMETAVANDEAALLTRGRVLRFALNGVDRFAAIIRPRRQTSVTASGLHAGADRTVRCLGLLSEWDRAVLPPPPQAVHFPGADTRHFGWMSPEADTSDMDEPDILGSVFREGQVHPEPWVDLFGASFDATEHRYFVFDQTIEDDPTSVSVHLAAMDQVNVWCASQDMGSGKQPPESSWANTSHGGAKLPAGTIRWGIEVQGLPGNTAAKLAATCFEINDATTGQMSGDTILWRTGYITGVTPYPWKCSATPQGPTVKQIIRSVLEQVQDEQGLLLDWEIDGADDTLDSNGNALDRIPHVPFPTGSKLATEFLLPLAASWCDLGVSVAGKTLYVYRWRERGNYHLGTIGPVFSDTQFRPWVERNPNILSLTHEERT